MQIRTEDDHYVIEFFNQNTSTEIRLSKDRLLTLRDRIGEILNKENDTTGLYQDYNIDEYTLKIMNARKSELPFYRDHLKIRKLLKDNQPVIRPVQDIKEMIEAMFLYRCAGQDGHENDRMWMADHQLKTLMWVLGEKVSGFLE